VGFIGPQRVLFVFVRLRQRTEIGMISNVQGFTKREIFQVISHHSLKSQ